MKSFYSIILVFGVVFSTTLALTAQEKYEAQRKVLIACKESTGATNDDVKLIVERKTPTEYTGKCLLRCAYEKVGNIQDGKFLLENYKTWGEKQLENDSGAIGIFNEILDECKSVSHPDICEFSANMFDCMNSGAVKRNIDPKTFKKN